MNKVEPKYTKKRLVAYYNPWRKEGEQIFGEYDTKKEAQENLPKGCRYDDFYVKRNPTLLHTQEDNE